MIMLFRLKCLLNMLCFQKMDPRGSKSNENKMSPNTDP